MNMNCIFSKNNTLKVLCFLKKPEIAIIRKYSKDGDKNGNGKDKEKEKEDTEKLGSALFGPGRKTKAKEDSFFKQKERDQIDEYKEKLKEKKKYKGEESED